MSAIDIDGSLVDFSSYIGKKVLIVNVASKCGYTSQYKDLQELHNRYNDKITILAFPSNNFGFQEPGSNDQIEEFTVEWQYSYFTAEKALGGAQAPASTRSDVATGKVI